MIVFYLQVPAAQRRAIVRAGADAPGGPQDPAVLYTADDVVADLDGLQVERAERVERPV